MKHEFTAIIERGETFLIATCPEVPEAHGQGTTREEVLRDLAGSIQSVLDYRRSEALQQLRSFLARRICRRLSLPDPPSK